MYIIKIEQYDNGAHPNQSWPDNNPIPEGYAKISDGLGEPNSLENFPYGNITIETIDGIPTVTKWEPLPKEDFEEPELPETLADTIHRTASSGVDSI